MKKSRYRPFYASPELDDRIEREAQQRGMNKSELIRYVLTLFFDMAMDEKPVSVDGPA